MTDVGDKRTFSSVCSGCDSALRSAAPERGAGIVARGPDRAHHRIEGIGFFVAVFKEPDRYEAARRNRKPARHAEVAPHVPVAGEQDDAALRMLDSRHAIAASRANCARAMRGHTRRGNAPQWPTLISCSCAACHAAAIDRSSRYARRVGTSKTASVVVA